MAFNQRMFVPSHTLARQFGVKMIGFGPPGQGKTPLMATAPNACGLIIEQGAGSLANSNFPVFDAAGDIRAIRDWMLWVAQSAEVRNYDTIMVDSISQAAEISLRAHQATNKNGLKAYGDMAKEVLEWGVGLHSLRYKHVYLIAKEGYNEDGGVRTRRPFFPGKELHTTFPHTYDCLVHVGLHDLGPQIGIVKSLQCAPTHDTIARDRFGNFDMYEPPNLAALFQKAMRNAQPSA